MTEARHTPGPWFVHDIAPEDTEWTSRFEVWAGERDEDAEDEHGIPCAGLITSHVKGEANARLIAAAPEMREALKKARTEMAALVLDPDNPDFNDACHNPADAECLEVAYVVITAALKSADGESE